LPKSLWPALLRGAVGFLAGLAFWFALSVPYARVLAALSEPLVRLGERPAVTRLIPRGAELTIDRADFAPTAARPALALMGMTFNIILLTTLFAANPKPLSDRNVGGLFLASLALVIVHVAAVVANVQSIYALQLGPWSAMNYGAVARNFWGAAAHFYTLLGAFGAPFALWWLFRPAELSSPESKSGPERSHASRRRSGRSWRKK
jgi:hypothetical protein